MIECESCERNFNSDDIRECPECGKELCPECYENHISRCILSGYNFDEEYEEESLIPHECPNCGEKLELDVDPDGSARVYCSECDFIEELNKEQLAELNQYDDDEYDVYDEYEDYEDDCFEDDEEE